MLQPVEKCYTIQDVRKRNPVSLAYDHLSQPDAKERLDLAILFQN